MDGAVMRMPVGGGTPIMLASGQLNPQCVAVDATAIYWTNEGTIAGTDGTVMKLPAGGGAPMTLADGQYKPFGIAIDATRVYWTQYASPGAVMTTSKN
jgi:hypothetical protein